MLDGQNLINDDFQQSSTLFKWLELEFTVNDKDGKEPLNEAINKEQLIGIGNLPDWFAKYFAQEKTLFIRQQLPNNNSGLMGLGKEDNDMTRNI